MCLLDLESIRGRPLTRLIISDQIPEHFMLNHTSEI